LIRANDITKYFHIALLKRADFRVEDPFDDKPLDGQAIGELQNLTIMHPTEIYAYLDAVLDQIHQSLEGHKNDVEEDKVGDSRKYK
jgi:hypothetical protein